MNCAGLCSSCAWRASMRATVVLHTAACQVTLLQPGKSHQTTVQTQPPLRVVAEPASVFASLHKRVLQEGASLATREDTQKPTRHFERYTQRERLRLHWGSTTINLIEEVEGSGSQRSMAKMSAGATSNFIYKLKNSPSQKRQAVRGNTANIGDLS